MHIRHSSNLISLQLLCKVNLYWTLLLVVFRTAQSNSWRIYQLSANRPRLREQSLCLSSGTCRGGKFERILLHSVALKASDFVFIGHLNMIFVLRDGDDKWTIFLLFIIIIIIIIIGIQPLGRSGQRPEFSQVTGMALVGCILGKLLGVACHCFPPLFRCSHFSPTDASTFATTWEIPAAVVGTVGENIVR